MTFAPHDATTNQPERDYTALYLQLCNCAGPQPSRTNARGDEHALDCPYRLEVDGDVDEIR